VRVVAEFGVDLMSVVPANIRAALNTFHEPRHRRDFHAELQDLRESNIEQEEEGTVLAIEANLTSHLQDGSKRLEVLTSEQLSAYMGLRDAHIPGMVTHVHVHGAFSAWDKPDEFNKQLVLWKINPAQSELRPFRLHHHQLVGVAHALDCIFANYPVALFDEVGVGKTIQILALIAMLAYFYDYFEAHHEYPGKFGVLCLTRGM
jgi:SNF2 family DNA or RNA helicase